MLTYKVLVLRIWCLPRALESEYMRTDEGELCEILLLTLGSELLAATFGETSPAASRNERLTQILAGEWASQLW